MKKNSVVVVNLQNPREKMFGILQEINPSGMTILGLDVNSFNDWMNQFSGEGKEQFLFPTTVFYPMHRVLSCYLDEEKGENLSFSNQFRQRTGNSIKDALQ